MTAAGWASFPLSPSERTEARRRIRQRHGIAPDAIVIGIAGSLAWSSRRGYCYGYELVQAIKQVRRPDVAVLIVGDGNGRDRLETLAGARLGRGVHFTGRMLQAQVPHYLAAMDVASLPQSVDGVGCFRYTTKLSEYIAAGLPVVTGQIPLAYDLDDGWLWRLPGSAPWDERYLAALAELLDGLTPEELTARAAAICPAPPLFDRERQVRQVTAFVGNLLNRRP